MTSTQKNVVEAADLSVEERLRALYKLQLVWSNIDKIRITRGELPLDVKNCEDEVAGLETRIAKLQNEIKEITREITNNTLKINEAKEIIAKKEEAQQHVVNSREYEALNKEIEYQTLEIESSTKNINKLKEEQNKRQEKVEKESKTLEERKVDLEQKRAELDEIVAETRQEEEQLLMQIKELEPMIDERLLAAFKRIRKNARNGLAVVTVDRDACGGCFNKIPPQRQLDIKMRKKIIVCEFCGRILVDGDILNEEGGATEGAAE